MVFGIIGIGIGQGGVINPILKINVTPLPQRELTRVPEFFVRPFYAIGASSCTSTPLFSFNGSPSTPFPSYLLFVVSSLFVHSVKFCFLTNPGNGAKI